MKRRWTLMVAAVALATAGLGLAGDGVYLRAKAILAQHLLSWAWAETREGHTHAKPWPWADTWPVARLRVPSHGVDQIVLAGGSGSTLAFGPGLVAGTAFPGTAGVSVIGGHRDTHFRFLEILEPGDLIEIETPDGAVKRFRVAAAQVMHKDRARLPTTPGAAVLVLATCYPFDAIVPGGPLRYVVTARAEEEHVAGK
jgi:sortase A